MNPFRSFLFSAFVLLSFPLGVKAQTVYGKIVDITNAPLSSARVVLRSLPDSSLVSAMTADEKGEFAFSVVADREYLLSVSFIGYQTVCKNCKEGYAGTFVMHEDAKSFSEAQIVASRIRRDANGYTAYLRSSDITKGKQSSDVLVFLPGVNKEDGIFKINGLPVSDVYVDGVKLPSLAELDNIPASMIDKVKVNYLAGSNENAALTGGVLAISLRRPTQNGYYGSFTAGVSAFPKYGFNDERFGGVFYGKYKNLNVYDNLLVNFNQSEETAEQSFLKMADGSQTNVAENIKTHGHAVKNRLSLTFPVKAKNSLGVSYYIGTDRLKALSNTQLVDNPLSSALDNRTKYLDQEFTLKGTTVLDSRGIMLECVGDYFNRRSDNKASYFYNEENSLASKEKLSLDMYKVSFDFTDSRNRKLVWKYGVSFQYVNSDVTPVCIAQDESGRYVSTQTATRTGGLTPLAYCSAMGQVWKIMYSAGLNFQDNRITYKTMADGVTSKSNQWGVNPTLQMMMPFGKNGKHALMVNYKRTLEDIPYAAISSAVNWSDAYNYTVGNPDLKAPTSHLVMAGFSLLRNTINLTALYLRSKNSIYWETQQSQTAQDVFYTKPVNLGASDAYGLGAEINWKPVKPWMFKLSGRLEFRPEDFTIANVHYGATRLRQYYTMYNTFSFKHSWGGMLSLLLEPTYKYYDRTYFSVYNIGGQIYKSLLKDKLQVTFAFNALGNRRKYDRTANGFQVRYDNTSSVQRVGLSVVWKFSGGKNTQVNAIENATQDFKEIVDVK